MASSKNYKTKENSMRYKVRYGTDANAALQPEYIPVPERKPKEQPRQRPRVLPQQKPQQKQQQQPRPAKRNSIKALLVLGISITAVMAFAVVMRNSQIYENNRQIQNMGQEVSQVTYALNTAKQALSAQENMDDYLKYASDELNMVFPESEDIVVIEVTPQQPQEDLTNTQKNGNIIDNILDWLNSLERRA